MKAISDKESKYQIARSIGTAFDPPTRFRPFKARQDEYRRRPLILNSFNKQVALLCGVCARVCACVRVRARIQFFYSLLFITFVYQVFIITYGTLSDMFVEWTGGRTGERTGGREGGRKDKRSDRPAGGRTGERTGW